MIAVFVRIVLDKISMSRFLPLLFVLLSFPLVALAQPTAPTPTTPPATAQAPAAVPAGIASVQTGIRSTASAGRLQDFCSGDEFGTCVAKIVGGLIRIPLALVGVILLGYILYAGFLWMTSGGESDKAEEAMKMIRNAVIGLVILASAFAIASFVLDGLSRVVTPSVVPAPAT